MRHSALLVLLVLLVLSFAAMVQAAEVRGSLSTLLAGRDNPRNGEAVLVVPLYELASVEVSALALPGTDSSRLVLQGWGRLDVANNRGEDNSADLELLYLDAARGPLALKLGRQHIAYGVGRMALIDGADARLELGRGVAAQAFFGWTVHPELRHRTDNTQGGGRLSYNLSRLGRIGELGVSYLLRMQKGETRREELGLDLVTMIGPTRWFGAASITPTGDRVALVDARLAGTWSVTKGVALTVDAERTAPELFLPVSSIFSVFSNATHDAVGGAVHFTPSPYWTLEVSGDGLVFDTRQASELGYRADVAATTYREPSHRSLVGAAIRRLDEGDNGYLRGRAFASLAISTPLTVSADLFAYCFDAKINDVPYSLLAQLSAVFDLTPSIRLAGTVAGGSTPWAKAQIEGLVRLAYGWDADLSGEIGP